MRAMVLEQGIYRQDRHVVPASELRCLARPRPDAPRIPYHRPPFSRPFVQWSRSRPGFGRINYAAADQACRNARGSRQEKRETWSNVERYIRLLQDGYRMSGGVGWVAPIGVATPLWGATNPIDIARPTLPSPWTSNLAGWYFVQAGGSNSGNGYPGNPRSTLPSAPSPGDKIVINGSFATASNVTWNGTAANPIWIMGYNTGTPPTLTNPWALSGSYLIMANVGWSYNLRDGIEILGNHLLLRDATYANPYDSANTAAIGFAGTYNVLYNVTVSQMGNWQYTGTQDIDLHGSKVGTGTDLWIVDSDLHHCHGDGVQVGDQNNAASAIQRVYIGRNLLYENYQTGAWTKHATDVIFSQNVAHDILTASAYGVGAGLGGQYDPLYVWYLFNVIYNCLAGIHVAGANNGGGGPWYYIGNVISGIDYPGGNLSYDGGAIGNRNDGAVTAIFNTLHDVDCFFSGAPGPNSYRIYNNICSTLKSGGTAFAFTGLSPTHDYNLFTSAAYDPGSEANRVVGDPLFVNAAARNFALQAASPAINAANPTEEAAFAAFQTRYSLDIRKDAAGASRPAAATDWDLGAYEYLPGAQPPGGLLDLYVE